MRFFRVFGTVSLLSFSWLPVVIHAQSGADIMVRADRMNRPEYEVSAMQMELVGSTGAVVRRRLIWYFRNEDVKRTSLMKFTSPSNMQGVGVLVIEERGLPNAIWHYLPASRNVRRISSAHRKNRFMGSEFVFEDFEGLKLDKYSFSLAGSSPCVDDSECYLVEARAVDEEERLSSSYGKKIYYVDKRNSTIVKTEFFGRDGKLEKVFETRGWRRVNGYWRPRFQSMTNVSEKKVTRLVEEERKIDEPFGSYYTGQQYLRSD